MPYKIICTDIDGTLLNKDREISSATLHAISRIKNRIPVILVSSRMPKAMRHIQLTLGIEHLPLIAYNGGLVWTYDGPESTPRPFLSIPIPESVTGLIYRQVKHTSIHISLFMQNDWFVESMDYWASREMNNTKVQPDIVDFEALIRDWEHTAQGPHKIMCMGPESEIHDLEIFLQQHFHTQLQIYRSKPTYLELTSKRVSKAVAIEKLLAEYFGFQMQDAVAFGDNYNDIEMLQAVGLGIAVANGNAALKSVADDITLSNVEDGVAVAIGKYFG